MASSGSTWLRLVWFAVALAGPSWVQAQRPLPQRQPIQYPPAPSTVTATQTSAVEITVTWTPVEGAVKYFIGRSVFPEGFLPVKPDTPGGTTYVDRDVRPGVKHIYVVSAINESGRAGQRTRSNELTPGGTVIPSTGTATTESRAQMVQRAYDEGRRRNQNNQTGNEAVWRSLADKSGMTYDELVASWASIYVVGHAFQHLLERQPNGEEVKAWVAKATPATNWHPLWQALATSPERDQRFGYYAPAPFGSAREAAAKFGRKTPPTPEQCFGAIGDKCEGGIPAGYSEIQPRWIRQFTMPDGTRMGYIEVGVAVGSILHDNACLQNREGLNCNGIGGGDLVKTGSWPGAMEWNKAAWNVLDSRNWRERFGPYPLDKTARREGWYDDLRPMASREAWMAPAIGMITIPVHTERYKGGETKASRRLKARAWRKLDGKDHQFCASGAFRHREETPLKAPSGTCR